MAQKLLQHKHCVFCGLAIRADEEYCSSECRGSHRDMLKRKKRQLLTLYVGSIVIVIILVLISLGGQL